MSSFGTQDDIDTNHNLKNVSAIMSIGSTTTQCYTADGVPFPTLIKGVYDCSKIGTTWTENRTNLQNLMYYLINILPKDTLIVIGNSAGYIPDGGKMDDASRSNPFHNPEEFPDNWIMKTISDTVNDFSSDIMLTSEGLSRFVLLNRNYKSANPGAIQTVGQWGNVIDEVFTMMDITSDRYKTVFDVGGSGAVCYQYNSDEECYQEDRNIDLGLSKKNGTSPNQHLTTDPTGQTLSKCINENLKRLYDSHQINGDVVLVCTGKIRELDVTLDITSTYYILDQNLECYGEAIDFQTKFNPRGLNTVNFSLESNGKILTSENIVNQNSTTFCGTVYNYIMSYF